MEYKKGLILILILTNIMLSSYLIYVDFSEKSGVCLTGLGCDIVKNSEYSKLFGVPLSWFGLISFIALLGFYYATTKKLINKNIFLIVSLFGTIFALYFLYLQIFIIKAICSTCLAIDISMVTIAVISFIDFRMKKN